MADRGGSRTQEKDIAHNSRYNLKGRIDTSASLDADFSPDDQWLYRKFCMSGKASGLTFCLRDDLLGDRSEYPDGAWAKHSIVLLQKQTSL